MIATRFNRFLREEAAELATGGGPAALPAAAAPAPALVVLPDPVAAEQAAAAPAAPVLAAAEPPREPTLLEKAYASFQGKAHLVAEANAAQAQLADSQRLIATLQGEKAALAAERDGLKGELEALRAERAEISALLDTAKATSAAAEDRAADIVAAVGFPAAALPAAEAEMEDTLETLTAKLQATTDPKDRWAISRKISALRWK